MKTLGDAEAFFKDLGKDGFGALLPCFTELC